MTPAIVKFKFGAWSLPVRGFQCRKCDRAAALGDELRAARAYAARMGLITSRRSASA